MSNGESASEVLLTAGSAAAAIIRRNKNHSGEFMGEREILYALNLVLNAAKLKQMPPRYGYAVPTTPKAGANITFSLIKEGS